MAALPDCSGGGGAEDGGSTGGCDGGGGGGGGGGSGSSSGGSGGGGEGRGEGGDAVPLEAASGTAVRTAAVGLANPTSPRTMSRVPTRSSSTSPRCG